VFSYEQQEQPLKIIKRKGFFFFFGNVENGLEKTEIGGMDSNGQKNIYWQPHYNLNLYKILFTIILIILF
jgi:hypothetical protein